MKIRQILSIGCFLWILASLRLAAQQPEIQPLPIDPKIRYGQLNNGLTYYIRHNAQPKDRADFFIAQNVGSILEDENQRGLAHFLEHMAFDGTKNFPGHGMDEFTESIGMRGGENFNAYTSFDETVYMIMNAPVTRESVVDSCLLILHDWSGFITLADTAIEKERGVIPGGMAHAAGCPGAYLGTAAPENVSGQQICIPDADRHDRRDQQLQAGRASRLL